MSIIEIPNRLVEPLIMYHRHVHSLIPENLSTIYESLIKIASLISIRLLIHAFYPRRRRELLHPLWVFRARVEIIQRPRLIIYVRSCPFVLLGILIALRLLLTGNWLFKELWLCWNRGLLRLYLLGLVEVHSVSDGDFFAVKVFLVHLQFPIFKCKF